MIPFGRWGCRAALVATILSPSIGAACSCERSSDGGIKSPRPDRGFVGRVKDLRRVHSEVTPSYESDSGTFFKVCFVVEQMITGAQMDFVCVRTGVGGGDCGYPFELGRRYKVFAHLDQGSLLGLKTGICDETAPL